MDSSHGQRASHASHDVFKQLAESLQRGRQTLAAGNMPADAEIQLRETLIQLTEFQFETTQEHAHLNQVIQHYRAIIRLLGAPSARRAKFLDKLAFVEMTMFGITSSMKTLNESVSHSKQARDEASITNDPVLPQIYYNLGYSLSNRGQLTDNDADLDEAIECGRRVLRLAAPSSTEYQNTVVNLASRLQSRYQMRHMAADAEEVLSLLDKQMKGFPVGTKQYGGALLVRTKIYYERYQRMDDPADAEQVISNCKAVLAYDMEPGITSSTLEMLSRMYRARYKHSNEPQDLKLALDYSKQKLRATPTNQPLWVEQVSHCLAMLAEYLDVLDDIDVIEASMKEARDLHARVPKDHAKRHYSNMSLAGILSRRFMLSHDLKHLSDLVEHAKPSIEEWNSKLDITKPAVPYSIVWNLSQQLHKLTSASESNEIRKQATERIYEWYTPIHKSRMILDGVIQLYSRHCNEIEAFIGNLSSKNRLSEQHIRAETASQRQSKATKEAEERERYAKNPIIQRRKKDAYTDPVFGTRNLAIEPDSKRMIFSMEGMVRDILGYADDEEEPKTLAELEAREIRLERISMEKERKEGKHPNPNLCRMCRYTKLLTPKEGGGFTWRTKQYVPFGLYWQLQMRKHCAICRLILSLSTVDGGNTLHPRLAQIDHEIQGTQFHLQRLPGGEDMLGIEYGMTTVGALRILSQDNLSSAIRQFRGIASSAGTLDAIDQTKLPSIIKQNDQTIDFANVREMIYTCHNVHGQLCNGPRTSPRYTEHIPLLLIDVEKKCLVSATSASKYFTLSYVWGKVKIPRTLKENLSRRKMSGSLNPSDLPRTIGDAMIFVRSIGERYLWTDSICIVQDDKDMMQRDIPRMDIVYNNAFANVVAISGEDANSGLPGVSPNSRPPQMLGSVCVSNRSTDLAHDETSKDVETVHLVTTPIPLSFVQTSSKWNTRGWILQEQKLARRNIYFSPTYVYLECAETEVSETALRGEFKSLWSEAGDAPTDESVNVFNVSNPLVELRRAEYGTTEERLRNVLKAYCDLVTTYTSRDLTNSADILDAFSGMLSAFKEDFRSANLYGLPIAALDLALLWTPMETLSFRATDNPKASSTPSSSSTATVPEEKHLPFPTWSWAGWKGLIDYRLLQSRQEPLPDSLISDFYVIQNAKILRLLGYGRGSSGGVPETPQDVVSAHFGRITVSEREAQPDTILHLIAPFALNKGFHVNRKRSPDYLSDSSHIHLQTKQAVVRLLDKNGKHCGILFEHIDYHWVSRLVDETTRKSIEDLARIDDKVILAVSKTKDTYGERNDLTRPEGNVARFDNDVYPDIGPGSSLLNVLVLRHKANAVFERFAVGQIHVQAWEQANPVRGWIKLG